MLSRGTELAYLPGALSVLITSPQVREHREHRSTLNLAVATQCFSRAIIQSLDNSLS